MTVTGVTVGTSNSNASIMNSDVSLVTYADFGQNLGWYKTDADANALLTHLRQQQGGVTISYLGGQETYTLQHEMGNFTGATDNGAFMALGYNATVSVQHNGVFAGNFTAQYVGSDNAVFYQGIEYRIDNSETFLHSPKGGYDGRGNGGFDHKVTRMSKVITDVEGATLFSGTSEEMRNYVVGELVYHVGAGTMQMYDAETGKQSGLTGAYNYIVGGIETATHSQSHAGGDVTYIHFEREGHESITVSDPLPFAGQQGDSGSPMFVYNENTGQYEYIGAVAYIGGNQTQIWGAIDYVRGALTQYDKVVKSNDSVSELHIGAVDVAGQQITADSAAYNYGMNQTVTTTPYTGAVKDANGNVLQNFVGVQTDINTWKNLSSIRDTDNWYSYNNDFLNAAPYISGTHATEDKDLTYADLFVTENLVFAAGTAQTNIVLDATVDLGIGYAHFGLDGTIDNPLTSARYDISAKGDYQFNHAGYVIDRGVDVYTTLNGHQTLENGDSYMFEWRKTGAGNLHIEGSGDNDIFLNVGGEGKTYLNRENGYAAYNVLANTHTTVVITDANQIYRDFTFGHQGGVLDMNGDSMEWNNDNDGAADGFTIHAQDEQAIVANLKSGSTTTLTWTQGGAQTFLGSFADNGKDSALKFVYNGGEDASLTLHSIKTHLTHANSGMEVQSGTVTLVGTNTVHGKGSLTGTNANRYHSDLDWHYADATANVTVTGGTFELGSHARLTGNVTVQAGGTFLMREGVQHAQEYVEGSTVLMNTGAIDKFYGLKGNVSLASGGTMRVEYNEGVTVNNTYAGNISGAGAVSIDLGAVDAMFTLAGRNTFTGAKSLEEGILIGANVAAMGNVGESQWLIGRDGTLQVASGLTANNALSLIDTASTGTLALTENMTGVLDMSQSHTHLFVGAEMGKTVQYGAKEDTLNTTSDNTWNLGGGGGELVVNAALQNAQGTLVLGNGQGLGGIVTLTNTGNSIGAITFNAGVTLSFTDTAALGNARIDLVYGSSLLGSGNSSALLNLVTDTSKGAILLDRAGNENFDLSGHSVALGSSGNVTYDGKVSVDEDGIYRFGGGSGTLTLAQALARNGVNNLEIDGQGHSGSKIVLGAVSDITGAVTVQGSAQGSGSITLGFTANDALSSASQTTIRKGGIIDLGSTTQTLTNLQVSTGGLLTGGKGSTAVFNMTGERIQYGSMLLDQAEKVGAANLVLASTDNTWNLFTIKEGTVFTRVDNALSSTGITRVESGATLNMNTWNADGFRGRTMHGNVLLAGGTLAAGDGSYDIIFNGTISSEVGMTGHINGGAKWVLNSSDNNRDGGTIQFNAARLELNQGYEQYIGGTFVVGGNTMALHSNGATENMLKHFNSLNVASGKTLNITERTWNTIWQLDELTGEGTINWDSTTTHSKTARMILGGEGEFSGTINMLRRYADGGRTHQAFIEINGENAVSGATLNFSGTGAQSQASLAINADNVNVGGLQSNVSIGSNAGANYAHIYAGAAPEDAASTAARAATRKATLTITGSGDYTYAGTVGTTSDTATKSLNVTMAGTGTQSFEGGTFVVGDLTAKSGNLRVLTTGQNTFTVMGDINLHQGGTLTLSKGTDDSDLFADYTLGSGHTLNVLQGSTGSATLNANLVLGGGTLNFDGKALSTSSPLLNLADGSKVTYADGTSSLVITLSNTSNLYVDNSSWGSSTTYQLSSEDWSGISASSITLANMPHLNAVFNASASGLSLTLSYANNSSVWAGNSTSRFWTPGTFGGTVGGVSSTGVAVFDDSASYNDVIVDKSSSGSVVNVAKMTFNASEDYTLTADRVYDGVEVQLNASSLDQLGSGTTTLYGNIVVSGETAIANGNLVITRAGQLQGLIGGEGMLTVDAGANTISDLNIKQLGTLNIKSGTYSLAADANNNEINNISKTVVGSGATLALSANATLKSNMELAGTVSMDAGVLKGQVALTGDATLAMTANQTEIEAAINGADYTLTKTGSGKLVLKNQEANLKQLKVEAGTLQAGGQLVGLQSLHMGQNSVLLFDWGSGVKYTDALNTEIVMDKGSTIKVLNAGVGTIAADVKLAGSYSFIHGGYYGSNCAIYGTISTDDAAKRTLTLRNEEGHQWTIASNILDGNGVIALATDKSGGPDPNIVLSGNNAYSGGTMIEYGTITTSHANALGTGVVSLGGYGSDSDGKLLLNKNLTISAVASTVDYNDNITTAGTISLNRKTLTVGAYDAQDAVYAGSFNNSLIGSIAKIGSNRQEFTSATAKVENVSVQGGNLVFSNEAAQIVGDIEVGTESGEGALTMAGSYTLSAERTLSILSTDRSTLGGLTLNGGVMALLFDDSATAETVALTVTGEVHDGSMTILLNGVMPTAAGEYLLVGGNWANVGIGGISVAVNDASAQQLYAARSADATPELYSSVKTTDSGLYLVLSEEAPVVNSNIWAPTEVDSDDIWSTTSFSQYDASALGDDVIFDASAIDKTVRVTENVSVSSMSIVGGGYTFSEAGQISTNVLEVSGAENGASTIDKIHVTDTIMVDGSELTILQLTPHNPSAPIVLTNAAKLTIGDDANRYVSFSGQVTGDAGSQLHLYTKKVHNGYWGEDGTVQLLEGSTVQDVYIHGDLALNIIAGSQGSLGDKFTNVQAANLHMEAGSQLVVRAEEGTGITPTTGNIVLGGDLSIVTYSPLTTATSITSNFTQEADATTNLKKMDTGSITLSGSIDVDTITVEKGTLSLTGSSIASSAYSVASGATLQFAGAADSAAATSALLNATGAGNLVLDGVSATWNYDNDSDLTGKLTLRNATLTTHGFDGNVNDYKSKNTANLSSFSSVLLDNALVKYVGATTTLNNVTVSANGAEFNIRDMGTTDTDAIKFEGTTTLEGTLKLSTTGWKSQINIASLTGSGTLNVEGAGEYVRVNLASTSDYTGNITVSGSQGRLILENSAETAYGLSTTTVTLSSGGSLYMNGSGALTLNSKLVVSSGSTSVLRNDSYVESMRRTLAAVEIAAGATLELQQASWNTIWNINDLSGEGNLQWASTTNHNTTSRLILSGDGSDYTGQIIVNRSYDAEARRYQAYVELASDDAVKNSLITLNCTAAQNKQNAMTTLAINTANAKVGGLASDEYAHMYAGASVAQGNAGQQASTAAHTLTITGDGTQEFKGTIGTSTETETEHLNLVMMGEGSQTFSGQAYVGNVSVSNGSLILSNATVDGDVTVNGGALTMTGSTYTLGEGDMLSVLTTATDSVQLGGLVLAGGEMVFDASMLSGDTAALSVGTLSLSEGTSTQRISFHNDSQLETGLYLLSGNWLSPDGIDYTTAGLKHGTGSVIVQDGGLYLDYTAEQREYTWTGATDGNWNYSSLNWDNTPDVPADEAVNYRADRVAIFNTDANVTVTEAVNVSQLIVRDEATVSITETAMLTTQSIEIQEGATLSFETVKAGYNGANISGAGTVELKLTNEANALNVGEAFTGETYVKAGKLSVTSDTKVGTTLRLADGVNLQANAVDISFDLVLDGTTSVQNTGTTCFRGSVTGDGTFAHGDTNGYFEFYDEVNMGGLTHVNCGTWGREYFKDTATIGNVEINGGEIHFEKDSTIGTLTLRNNNTNHVKFYAGATHTIGDVSIAGGSLVFEGTADITTATISGGTVKFVQDSIGSDSGTITMTGGKLELNKSVANAAQTVYSTLIINNTAATADSKTTVTLDNVSGKDNMTRTLSAVQIAAHNILDLKQSGGWNTIWNINSLSGEGELKWSYNQNHYDTSRLIISGDNDFSGQITLNRVAGSSTNWGYYLAYVELAHDGAAKNATIALNGTENNGYAGLAISADNAQVQGINGSYAHIVSGASPIDSAGNGAPHASTESNTLTIVGSDEYAYSGTIGTAASGANRLSLVMSGTGRQSFTGQSYLHNITVNNGILALDGADVSGDVTVHAGGSLTLSALTLGAGQTLSVLTGTAGTVSLGALTLSGGELTFDASLLKADEAALGLTGVLTMTEASNYTVNVGAGSALTTSGSYKLADGDWSAAAAEGISFTVNGLAYGGTGTINATADGLFLNYSVDTIYTWTGSAGDNAWGTANWDTTPGVEDDSTEFGDAADTIAVFRSNATVNVTDAVTVGTVSILDGAEVTLGMSGEGASLTAGEVLVENGKLSIALNTNMTGISSIKVAETGVLELGYGAAMNNADDPVDILLQGGTINLRNGAGTHHTLHASITVDEAGTIAGSLYGGDSTVSGSITGTGTLTFAKELVDHGSNPMTVASTITNGAEGALGLHVVDTNVVLSGTNTYTGGTVIGRDGKLTITNVRGLGGSQTDASLGSVSGEGTLALNISNGGRVHALNTGNSATLKDFTGTIEIQKGIFQVGAGNTSGTGADATFDVSKVVVYNGATFVTHFGYGANGIGQTGESRLLPAQMDLMSGATLQNIDGLVNYAGDVRFNVDAEGAYTDGTVSIRQYWSKTLTFSGLLAGQGTVELYSSEAGNGSATYVLTHEDNTFSGTYKLTHKNGSNRETIMVLQHQNAAQFATIDLAGTTGVSKLQLDSSATISALLSTDADNLVTTTGAYTLTVSSGNFAGKLQNGTGTLSLTKQGNGTLTLSGANSYTGATTVSGGTLELAGAVSMAAESAISLADGTTLLLNATNDAAMTLGNAITGEGKIKKEGSGETVLAGNVDIEGSVEFGLTSKDAQAGTLSFVGESVALGGVHMAYGTLNIGDGANETMAVLGRLEAGDSPSTGGSAVVNVKQNATLSITGSKNDGNDYRQHTLLLGEWGQKTNLHVAGVLLSKDAKVLVGDHSAGITIQDGGVMAVKGITHAKNDKTANSIEVTLENGGKLILGDAGITTNKAFSATLGAGTVGMSAATTTITEDLTLTSAEGTTFDTTQYVFETNANGVATDIVRGTEGGVMTLTGAILGNNAKMNVVGAGTLNVTGAASLGYLDVAAEATVSFAGGLMNSTEVNGETFKSPVQVTGAGKLQLLAGASPVEARLQMDGYTGRFTVSNSANLTADITVAQTVDASPTLEITEDIIDTSLSIALQEGATLLVDLAGNNTVNITELGVADSAVFKAVGGTADGSGTSIFNINELSSQGDLNQLNVVTLENATNDFTIFNVENADFNSFMGNLVLKGNQAVLNLDYTYAASDEVPNLSMLVEFDRTNAAAEGEQQALGIVRTTYLKGIQGGDASSVIVAGHVTNKTSKFESADEDATMNLGWGAGAGEVYESAATIKNNLNVVKQGSAKQIFTGDTTEFDGTVLVDEGELAFGKSELQTADTTVGSGDASLCYGYDADHTDGRVKVTANNSSNVATLGAVQFSYDEAADMVTISSHTPQDGEEKKTVTATNSLITIAEGASLTVDSMIISDSSRLAGTAPAAAAYALRNAGGVSELTLTDSTVVLGSGNASVVGDTTAQTLAALQPMGGNGQALTMDGTSNVMNITSNALSNLVLTSGSNFVVDFSQLLTVSDLRGVDFIQLDFNNVSISTTDMSMTGLLTTSTGAQFYMNAYFVGEAVADVGSIYFDVRSIPEPTSTTLSILALAALAARRRRK